uniref:Uncharacterized protein n=1 Tax=Arion vulgaris TaxID=1028688 RepID=A0A0B6ZH93_9EUPU
MSLTDYLAGLAIVLGPRNSYQDFIFLNYQQEIKMELECSFSQKRQVRAMCLRWNLETIDPPKNT